MAVPNHLPAGRRRMLAAGASVAAAAFIRFPSEAAQFDYKLSHGFPTTHPFHIRMVEMWNAVRDETNGRLVVATFGDDELGSPDAALEQLRAGALQFVCEIGATLGGIVPAAAIEGVGFAFKSSAEALAAMDGPLGAYVRGQIEAKGMVAYPAVYDVGMRQITSRAKPILGLADYAGFKIRVPTAKIVVDLFATLGASPTPLPGNALYTSLQTRVVDGCEFPLSSIEAFKIYEVQKYVTMTNHMWVGYWLLGNVAAIGALPVDIRTAVVRNNQRFALLERRDVAAADESLKKKLTSQGMSFGNVDPSPLRAKLAPYYARWKASFGEAQWSLLERTSGRLG